MSIKSIKIISACLSLAGIVINLTTNALGDKMLDNKIESKISDALSKKN